MIAASREMKIGDWKKCYDFIVNEQMNNKVKISSSPYVKNFINKSHQRLVSQYINTKCEKHDN